MTSDTPSFGLNGTSHAGSLVSAEAVWEGRITTSGDLRVEGTIHGEIEADGSLAVAAQAHIDGTIVARRIVLAGEIRGEVRCEERLELLTGSNLGGDVETGTLVVHEGAYIEANRFKMLRSEAPS